MKKYLSILFFLITLIVPGADGVALSAFDGNLDIKSFAKELNISPTIIGDDDREEITNENAKDLEKAVVVLGISYLGKFYAICSGAMVGPNIVLTAAHCLVENGKYREDIEVLAVAADKSDNKLLLSAKSTELYVPQEYIELSRATEKQEYDYGVIVLDKPIAIKTGWFKLNNRSTPRLKFANIITMGRPYDKPDDTLWKSEGSIGFWKVYTNNTFGHNADTLPGNSGGPIVLKKRPDEIIGIHIAHDNKVDDYAPEGYYNIGLRINKDIINAVQIQNGRSVQYLKAK